MDDNRSRTLDKGEFTKGLKDYGVQLSDDEINTIFTALDKDGSGSLDFEEFLVAIRVSNF